MKTSRSMQPLTNYSKHRVKISTFNFAIPNLIDYTLDGDGLQSCGLKSFSAINMYDDNDTNMYCEFFRNTLSCISDWANEMKYRKLSHIAEGKGY